MGVILSNLEIYMQGGIILLSNKLIKKFTKTKIIVGSKLSRYT